MAAAGAFLARAAELTLDPAKQARRALEAAEAKQLAGAPQEALSLLATAADGPLEEFDRAMLQRLHGQIALDLRRAADAVPLLLDAARRLEQIRSPPRARDLPRGAPRGERRRSPGWRHASAAAKAARKAPPRTGAPDAIDLLLDGLAARFTDGYAASAEALKRALAAVRDERGRAGRDVRWPWLARRVAPDLFDDDTWHAFATGNVQIARETGALAVLPLALNYHSLLLLLRGRADRRRGAAGRGRRDRRCDRNGRDGVREDPARRLSGR